MIASAYSVRVRCDSARTADAYIASGFLQDVADQRRGGRLAISTRDADDFRTATLRQRLQSPASGTPGRPKAVVVVEANDLDRAIGEAVAAVEAMA